MGVLERLINIFQNLNKRRKKVYIISFITFVIIMFMTSVHIFNKNLTSAMQSETLDDTLTVLLLGIDSEDFKDSAGELDSTFLVYYNLKTQNCQIISFPRDTLIPYENSNMKLRYIYKTGGETLVKNSIEDMLNNISLDGIIKVNLNGFRKIIDAMGGIDICIEQDMYYDDIEKNLNINFKAGETVHLNGEKAEEFFRWRNNNDTENIYLDDTDRIENQKLLIDKVIEKVMSFSSISNVNEIFKIIKDNVQTDLSLNQIMAYGLSFAKMDKEDIIVTTLKGEIKEVDGISYFLYDKSQIESLDTPYENLESLNALAYKNTIKIKIINCTKIKGLALEAKDKLESLGYSNISVSGTNELNKTEIYFNDEKYKELILKDFGYYKVEKNMPSSFDKDKEYDVVIALGKDYKKVGETK